MRTLAASLTFLMITGLLTAPTRAGGRTIAPRELSTNPDAPPRTVKLRPGEAAIYLRVKKQPVRGASVHLMPTGAVQSQGQVEGQPGKRDTMIFRLSAGRYVVLGKRISEIVVEAWGEGPQRVRKVPSQSGYAARPYDYHLVGAPEGFPSTYYTRTALHQLGTRRSAGYVYGYVRPEGGYGQVWMDTRNRRAHRLTPASMKGATSVERDGCLYLTVFNPLMKGGDAKLPAITGDVEVVGLTRQKDIFAGFSYLVLKPTKPQGTFKIADPRVLYANYAQGAGSDGTFAYRQVP